MSTKRRIGVSAASTEAARRQLMQPVACWEKVWVTPAEHASAGLKIYKWVKTEKTQQFSDDEGGADEPLAPLPDELEVVEGDEEDQEENGVNNNADSTQREASEAVPKESEPPSKLPSPKLQTLSMSLQPSELLQDAPGNDLDASLNLPDGNMDDNEKLDATEGMELDMSGLGPDGLGLDGSDLSQLSAADALLGGPLMDQGADPFSPLNE